MNHPFTAEKGQEILIQLHNSSEVEFTLKSPEQNAIISSSTGVRGTLESSGTYNIYIQPGTDQDGNSNYSYILEVSSLN